MFVLGHIVVLHQQGIPCTKIYSSSVQRFCWEIIDDRR